MGPETAQSPPPTVVTDQRPLSGGPDAGDTTLAEALTTLKKRKWIPIIAVIVGASYGAYKAYTQPKVYQATGTIQIHNGASAEYKLNDFSDYEGDSQTKMNTEVNILTSDTLLYTVAKEMNLANNQDFGAAPGSRNSLDDPNIRAWVVGSLRGGLRVDLVPRTEIISISYLSESPKLAADIVNKVIYDYKQRGYQTPVLATQQVSEYLSQQLDELKRSVADSQQQMMELQRKLGVLSYDSTHNQLSASLDELLNA